MTLSVTSRRRLRGSSSFSFRMRSISDTMSGSVNWRGEMLTLTMSGGESGYCICQARSWRQASCRTQ
jgi:hypothetical protein